MQTHSERKCYGHIYFHIEGRLAKKFYQKIAGDAFMIWVKRRAVQFHYMADGGVLSTVKHYLQIQIYTLVHADPFHKPTKRFLLQQKPDFDGYLYKMTHLLVLCEAIRFLDVCHKY